MNNVHESSNSVQSADDELDPLEFMKVELHEGKGGKTFSIEIDFFAYWIVFI